MTRKATAASSAKVPAGDAAPAVEVAVVVLVQVPGLRNGMPWPERGERWMLPADEAAQYGRLGLVRPVTD